MNRLPGRRLPIRGDYVVAAAVRLLVVGLGLAAVLVPLPGFTTPAAVLAVFALPLPLVAARWPGSTWVTGLLSISIAEWIIVSLFVGPPPVALTLVYGGLLYLLHTTTALAAALPMARQVEPVLIARVLMRVLTVLALSGLLMLAVLLMPARPGSLLLAAAGAAGALSVGVLLVGLPRRPAGG